VELIKIFIFYNFIKFTINSAKSRKELRSVFGKNLLQDFGTGPMKSGGLIVKSSLQESCEWVYSQGIKH